MHTHDRGRCGILAVALISFGSAAPVWADDATDRSQALTIDTVTVTEVGWA